MEKIFFWDSPYTAGLVQGNPTVLGPGPLFSAVHVRGMSPAVDKNDQTELDFDQYDQSQFDSPLYCARIGRVLENCPIPAV